MNFTSRSGAFKRFSASTTSVLCSGPCALIGVGVAGVTTAQFVQIWDSSDVLLASGTIVVGTCSLATSTFYEVPAMLANGLTIEVLNEAVDLTFYWIPAGNNT